METIVGEEAEEAENENRDAVEVHEEALLGLKEQFHVFALTKRICVSKGDADE